MSRSLLHDWEYNIERCCRENDPTEMKSIAEDIYNTAYARGKNQSIDVEEVLDKIRADIIKFADTIPFNIGEVKAKYRNIGQHDGLLQALEIIEGNIKGDFDIDEWMAENE